MTTSKRRPWRDSRARVRIAWLLYACMVFAALVWLYADKTGAFFIGEDTLSLIATSRLDEPGAAWRLASTPLMEGTSFTARGLFFRPVASFIFGLEHAAFGLSSRAFHLLDLGWHAAVAVLLGLLVWRLSRSRAATVSAVLLFLVHPVLAEVVPPTSRRQEAMWTAFVLGAILLARSRDGRGWASGPRRLTAVMCTALAVGIKSTGVLAPVMIAASAAAWPENCTWRARGRPAFRAVWPHVAVVAAMGLWQLAVLGGAGGYAAEAPGGASAATRALQVARYAFDVSGVASLMGWGAPGSRIAAVMMFVALAGLSVAASVRGRPGVTATGAGGLMVFLWIGVWAPALASVVTGAHTPRYAYAGVAFLVALVSIVPVLLTRLRDFRRGSSASPWRPAAAAAAAVCAVIVALAGSSRTRAATREWVDNAELTRQVLTRVDAQLSRHPGISDLEVRCAPVVVVARVPRVRTLGQMADHTVASWLALRRPGRPVTIRMADRRRVDRVPVRFGETFSAVDDSHAVLEFDGCRGTR